MSNKGNITEREADPHPSDEKHYDRTERPDRSRRVKDDIGPNDAVHDGTPQERPDNIDPRGPAR